MHNEITVISSLPPIIGLSPYTKGFVSALSKNTKVNFLGFNHIYPQFLYPGKLRDESLISLQENDNLRIRNVLNWYNPIGWIIEAFRIKTDIIHAQWWSFPLAPIYITILGISKFRGKKILLTVHNVMPHEKKLFKILLNKSVFFLGSEFIVHTQNNKEALQAIIKKKPIHILQHGLIEYPTTGITKEAARNELQIDLKDKILLCFGHIRDYKGLDAALEALAQVNEEQVKLIIAGKSWEDWDKYEQLIKKYRLKKRVILHTDFIPTQRAEIFFKASDIVLLPYKYFDAQSGVGAAVLPFEIPLIVADTGGLKDFVSDDVCIFTPGDSGALAYKITQMLHNERLYNKIKGDISAKAKAFSWETIIKDMLAIYERLLTK